ncbi:MAG: alpha/beta hydrolase family protein [Bacteroidales bacterium]|jgi:hypothetical protein|nr:alpha/beta hydrolase family protein [Bacteroidales bacterium]
MNKLLILAGSLCFASTVVAQDNYNALSWQRSVAYNSYLMREVHRQYADRQNELAAAWTSKDKMLQYQEKRRESYLKIIGTLPQAGALNGKVTGVSQHDGYRIEKIIYESTPKRYVTTNLFIPDGKGPFAAVVILCGHGLTGKNRAPLQAVQLAVNGIASIVVDPVSQGERIELLDEHDQPTTRGVTTEHTLLNAGCNLLGSSVAAYEYWDNHRAVDYLETRSEIDANRIGVFGSSGGGTQAAYMVGLEERIKAASICSYFSQRERVLELEGPSDGCQHVPYEGREGIEIADFVLMYAPKPVLIRAGRYDFVDFQGVMQGFRELEKSYEALGAKDKVSLCATEAGHGGNSESQQALMAFFKKYLNNDLSPVKPATMANIPLSETLCTATGQVKSSIPDAVSLCDYNLQQARQLAAKREQFLRLNDKTVRTKVLELLGVELPKEKIQSAPTGAKINKRTYDLSKYQIIRSGQIPVPCVVVTPEQINPQADIVIYLDDDGKQNLLGDEAQLLPYINRGDVIIAADLRGFGETADPVNLNDTKYWNREYRNAMISMHTGQTIMGQRVIDIISLLDFIDTQPDLKNKKTRIVARGLYGPAVIHAAYIDKRIQSADISRSVKSFTEYIVNPMQRDMYTNVLYGVLEYYDLQDLMKKISGRTVRFAD